jgi:hypothetical protein
LVRSFMRARHLLGTAGALGGRWHTKGGEFVYTGLAPEVDAVLESLGLPA